MEVMSVKRCLFCKTNLCGDGENGTPIPIVITHPSGETVTVKRESRDFIVSSSHKDFHIESQLKSIFILRNLLEISDEQCVKYLQQNEGSRDPSSWFSQCSKCNGVIEECHQIYREVLRWKRKLDKKKEWLKNEIAESRGTKWEKVSKNLESLFLEAADDSVYSSRDAVLLESESAPVELSPPSQPRRSTRNRKQVETDNNDDDLSRHATSPVSNGASNATECDNSDDDWHPSAVDAGMSPKKVSDEIKNRNQGVNTKDDQLQSPSVATRREYQCTLCVASYHRIAALNGHVKIHQLPPGLAATCQKCGWTFTTKVPRRHRESCRAEIKKIKCKLCPAEFTLKTRYQKHCLLHRKGAKNVRTCRKCGLVITKPMLMFHIRMHNQMDFNPKTKSKKLTDSKLIKEVTIIQENEETPYYCDHCHLMFCSHSQFLRHFSVAHKNMPLLECELCYTAKLESRQLLQLHLKLIHGKTGTTEDNNEKNAEECGDVPEKHTLEEFNCPHCSELFCTETKRDYHIAKFHWDSQLTCPICKNYSAKEFNLLRVHMNTHDNQWITTCKICSKVLRRDSVTAHMKLVHKIVSTCNQQNRKEVKILNCPDCPAYFRSRSFYKRHRQLHENGKMKDKAVTCVRCGWVHDKVGKHKCPKGIEWYTKCNLCPASYHSIKNILAHRELHESKDKVEGAFYCNKCGWLCYPKERATHRNRCIGIDKEEEEEEVEIPFYCDHCHMVYTKVEFLHQHCTISHKRMEMSTCTFCQQAFNSCQLLDAHHLENHSNEKNVLQLGTLENAKEKSYCSYCSETFDTKLRLDYHIAKFHQDIFLKCAVCKYEATELWDLSSHFDMSKHNTGDMVECGFCSKFQSKNSYPFHLRAMHFQKVKETEFHEDLSSQLQPRSETRNEQNEIPLAKCDLVSTKEDVISAEADVKSPFLHSVPSPGNDFLSDNEAEDISSDPDWQPSTENLIDVMNNDDAIIETRRVKRKIIVIATEDEEETLAEKVSLDTTSRKREKLIYTGKSTKKQKGNNLDKNLSNAAGETDTPRKYKCPECVAWYATRNGATSHSQIHKLPPGFIIKCGNCGWAFRNRVSKFHKLNQCLAPSKIFECKLCPAKFTTRKRYIKHLALHEMPHESNTCGKCGLLMPKNMKKKHMNMHRNIDFKKAGSLRKKRSQNLIKDKRKVGEPESEEETPYYCDHCHLIFAAKSLLTRHFNIAHKKYTPLVDCDLCTNTKFESKQLLQIHRKLVHEVLDDANSTTKEQRDLPENSVISCPHCPETFSTKMKMDYHIAKCHWETQLTCPICNAYSSKEFNMLREHMKTHDASRITMCEVCSKMIRKDTLPTHMRLFHYKELGVEPIQCQECKKIFRSEDSLKRHMDFVHLHNVANCCHLCPKKFQWKRELDLHIEQHLEPKERKYKKGPFFCKICQAKFNVRQGLYYHMKRLHSDKFLYRCDKCGKGYCFENTLIEHQNSCKAQKTDNDFVQTLLS